MKCWSNNPKSRFWKKHTTRFVAAVNEWIIEEFIRIVGDSISSFSEPTGQYSVGTYLYYY